MKTLILINQAPHYGYTYIEIGRALIKKGHKVIYALDSTFTFFEYESYFSSDDEVIIFSDFFKKNYRNTKISTKKFYDEDLWTMFFSDYERITAYGLHKKKDSFYFKSVIANLLNFFTEIFSSGDIDAILYENVSNSFAYAAYLVGKENNAIYLGLAATALPNRFSIEEHPFFESQAIMNNYRDIIKATSEADIESRNWAEDYYANFMAIEPDYMSGQRKLLEKNLASKYLDKSKLFQITFILRFFKKYGLQENFFNFQNPALLINWAYFKRNVRRKFRLPRINKLYDIQNIEQLDTDSNYLIYPIQFHPEASTSVRSPIYINEYYNILNISIQLPFNYTLLVKEHPSAVGFNKVDFYRKIKALPNVKLVNHNIRAKSLISLSKGVITATNTMGYEALIMNKKTFALGRCFYETHPNCVVINNFNELFKKIKNEIEDIEVVDPIKYIQAYYQITYPGSAVYKKEVNQKFVEQVSSQIIKRFES
ncbi:hypothetical protein JMN32_26355 [Fulvivirga sp. 29W222]|uniref:Capsule polysaccharide biosynthesis protein n=1 Tax=Fulvivirga marina TaxID=2494733 RepID=A0A937G379_9BACT|nr:hypothetical protein [Fulvivirga marina]MBL6449862.1 hypothetical protein [Fulvivirga marina]